MALLHPEVCVCVYVCMYVCMCVCVLKPGVRFDTNTFAFICIAGEAANLWERHRGDSNICKAFHNQEVPENLQQQSFTRSETSMARPDANADLPPF